MCGTLANIVGKLPVQSHYIIIKLLVCCQRKWTCFECVMVVVGLVLGVSHQLALTVHIPHTHHTTAPTSLTHTTPPLPHPSHTPYHRSHIPHTHTHHTTTPTPLTHTTPSQDPPPSNAGVPCRGCRSHGRSVLEACACVYVHMHTHIIIILSAYVYKHALSLF